jgi:hypothetical protein
MHARHNTSLHIWHWERSHLSQCDKMDGAPSAFIVVEGATNETSCESALRSVFSTGNLQTVNKQKKYRS